MSTFVVGMRATIHDVHHRHRQRRCARAGEVFPERQFFRNRHRVRICERNAEQRIRAELRLIRRAVEFDQLCVEALLIRRVETFQRLCDFPVDVRNGVLDAFAFVAPFIAVAQFHRFARAGRCTARHRSATDGTVGERDFGFERGIAARVENFAA